MSDHVVILCAPVERTEPSTRMKENIPPCPICGRKAYLSHDVVDGYHFGFSAGCPSFCLNDGKHGISDPDDPRCPSVRGFSFRSVYGKWLAYCKRMEVLKGEGKLLEEETT